MSWAEVKKINSDLDVPLDKLLRNYLPPKASNTVITPFVSGNYESLTEILSVTGEGKFITCECNINKISSPWTLPQLQIMIDDSIIIDINGDNRAYLKLRTLMATNTTTNADTLLYQLCNADIHIPIIATLTGTTGKNANIIEPLLFHESLKIKVKGSVSSANSYKIRYELYE